jgi:arylsulfatase A-like enzyme
VLLIILDTVRSASMHLYGYERKNSAVLERIAGESVIFDEAMATAPWTLPSHASMFTGLYPDELSADYVAPLNAAVPTLAERLGAHGFESVAFVANHHYTGFDTGLARGFTRYEDYKVSIKQTMRSAWPVQALYFFNPVAFGGNRTIVKTEDDKTLQVPPKSWAHAKRAEEVADEFLTWHGRRQARPYFAFLNMYDAHDPRYAPPVLREQFRYQLPNTELYDAAISYMDREIGRVLDTLAARRTLDHTVVIVASDHGELFGTHQLWGHANNLYLDVLRVPLVVRYPPRVPGGKRVVRATSLRDLAATITDLAGLPETEWLPGSSLVPLMASGDSATTSPVVSFAHRTINLPPRFPAARGDMYSVIDDSLHYIRNTGDNGEELFAWKTDREERRDLSKTPEGESKLQGLRALARRRAGSAGGQGR